MMKRLSKSSRNTGPVWTPISWDNITGDPGGTLTTLGNGGIQKTAGPGSHWNTVATSNTHFSSFPITLRFKVSAGIFDFGFADQANNKLANVSTSGGTVDGTEEQETWAIGQVTSPGANGALVVWDNTTGWPSTGITQNQTDYYYLHVAANGTVTMEDPQGTINYTYSINALGKTLIPFVAIWDSNFAITESAWIAV